jgi:DNA polymerase-3 subunit beta
MKGGGPVRMYRDQNQVLFRSAQAEFISRLGEGNFPDYQAIIPKDFQTQLVVEREEFMNALKLSSVFGGAGTEITLRSAGGKAVELFSRNEKLGENTYSLAAKVEGELQEVNFNARYLLDGLKAVGGKEVSFSIGEENRPALLRSQGDASYFYIVMPVLKA